MTPLSIVVPALDEAGTIAAVLAALAPLRHAGHQVIVVDGGSTDGTPALCRCLADLVLVSRPGRARQANAGAAASSHPCLLFLHADTLLPADADLAIARALSAGALWGRFDVRISGRAAMLRVIAAAMNLRSRASGIATGDQAIFVTRAAFEAVGGFPDQALMEDIEISRRLLRLGRPACLRDCVVTSGRRWERDGVWSTMARMWWLRWRYWRGDSPDALARAYR